MALCAPSHLGQRSGRDRTPVRNPNTSRRSSGVERAIGNGEVDSSILSGGTIIFCHKSLYICALIFSGQSTDWE